MKNTGHEDDQAAEAVARVEVTVGDDVVKRGNVQEIANDDDLRVKRIGESSRRMEIGTARLVILRCIGEFAQHGKASAGAPDGNAAANGVVHGALDGSAAPEIDVVRLVSAGNEDGGSGANGLGDEGIIRGVATGNDQRSNGIFAAERLDVRIVSVGAAGADNQEIAAAGALAKPSDSLVQVFATADERVACVRGRVDIVGASDAEVAVSWRVGGARRTKRRRNRSRCGDEYKDKRQIRDDRNTNAQEVAARRKFTPLDGQVQTGEMSARCSDTESRQ